MMGLYMIDCVRELNDEFEPPRGPNGENFLHIRVGIHSGDVIGGVMGRTKLMFDMWGENVTLARAARRAARRDAR